jgi:hypothetical protein
MGIPERIPYSLASYEHVLTTPRPEPFFGSDPTTTGIPFSSGFYLTSTAEKKPSISTWNIILFMASCISKYSGGRIEILNRHFDDITIF